MTNQQLKALLRQEGRDFRGSNDETWTLTVHGVPVQVFTNEAKDRMRVLAMVTFMEDLRPDQVRRVLLSNFHSDARYGLQEGILYSMYVHSLSGLQASDLRVALRQVAHLVTSFGTSYSSGPMRFEWPRPEEGARHIRRRTEESVKQAVQSVAARVGRDED